jgi:hypothetical protein
MRKRVGHLVKWSPETVFQRSERQANLESVTFVIGRSMLRGKDIRRSYHFTTMEMIGNQSNILCPDFLTYEIKVISPILFYFTGRKGFTKW